MKDLIQNLNNKYTFKEDPINFGEKLNTQINEFYADQTNVSSFLVWLDESSSKLDVELQPLVSTFFPSLSFSVIYEVEEYKEYKIYKEEIFCVSFLENYYTSCFSPYIKEKTVDGKVTYMPNDRPKRNSRYNRIYTEIIEEIQKRYPSKNYLDIKKTNYVLGEFKLTYSRNPKTTIFELLFRSKLA